VKADCPGWWGWHVGATDQAAHRVEACQDGGLIHAMPLPEWCWGTVVVHRYDAVTCTRDTCPTDLPLETWFSHHTSFVTCSVDDCPHCVTDPPVRLVDGDCNPTSSALLRRRRRGRLLESARRRHPSS